MFLFESTTYLVCISAGIRSLGYNQYDITVAWKNECLQANPQLNNTVVLFQ